MDRQTRLQRMKEFDAKTRAMNTRKGKARSTALAPPRAPLPPLKPGAEAPPTYLQQDQEQGVKDTETPQTEQQEEEQAQAVDKKQVEVGKKDFAKGQRSTTTVTTDTKRQQDVKGNFSPYLGHLVNRTVKRKYWLKEFTWLPNSIMLERILFSTHQVLRPSDYLWKNHKNYLSIMVTTYYSILFYIQILRVQTEIKVIDKDDSTWYRAFTRLFPEEKLVIAGPLEPFFSGLVAFKADDERFGMVFPRIPDYKRMFTKAAGEATWTFNASEFLTVPNVPGLFQTICKYVDENFEPNTAANYRRHQILSGEGDNQRQFIGRELPETGSWFYASSMFNRTHPDTKDMYAEAQDFWLNTRLDGAGYGRTTATATEAGYTSLGEFLQFRRNVARDDVRSGFSWFEELLNMAVVHSRFFEGATNLSQMPHIGGLDVPVQWLVDTLENEDADLTPPTRQWPAMFQDLRAKARIIIEETESLDAQTSAIHMTNAVVCYGRDARLTEFPAITRNRQNAFWTEQNIQYEDGSFHDVIIGGVSDIQADFYVPGGL